MLLIALTVASVALTCAMFATRNQMLGFPCMIFWAISSGYCYQQSTAAWDLYYLMFFSCAGMAIFSVYASYALRKQDLAGPDADKGKFIDEGGGKETWDEGPFIDEGKDTLGKTAAPRPSRRTQELRERAERRRTGGVKRKTDWGEFG